MRLLWTSAVPFGFDNPVTRFGISVPGPIAKTVRCARVFIFLAFLRPIARSAGSASVLQCDYPGHIALRTYAEGSRIFDLAARRARYVMPRAMPMDARRQFIEKRQQVAQHATAAKLLDTSLTEGWIDEEYVNGHHPPPFPSNTGWVLKTLIPIVAELIGGSPCPRTSIVDRANELRARIADVTTARRSKVAQDIFEASEYIVNSLPLREDLEIFMAPSHGDIWEANVLCEGDRVILIDWERYAQRSALFDVIFLHFHQLCWSPLTVREPGAQLDRYIATLSGALEQTQPELARAILDNEVIMTYRRLAYLEAILASLNDPLELGDQHLSGNTAAWAKAFCRVEADYDPGFRFNFMT